MSIDCGIDRCGTEERVKGLVRRALYQRQLSLKTKEYRSLVQWVSTLDLSKRDEDLAKEVGSIVDKLYRDRSPSRVTRETVENIRAALQACESVQSAAKGSGVPVERLEKLVAGRLRLYDYHQEDLEKIARYLGISSNSDALEYSSELAHEAATVRGDQVDMAIYQEKLDMITKKVPYHARVTVVALSPGLDPETVGVDADDVQIEKTRCACDGPGKSYARLRRARELIRRAGVAAIVVMVVLTFVNVSAAKVHCELDYATVSDDVDGGLGR